MSNPAHGSLLSAHNSQLERRKRSCFVSVLLSRRRLRRLRFARLPKRASSRLRRSQQRRVGPLRLQPQLRAVARPPSGSLLVRGRQGKPLRQSDRLAAMALRWPSLSVAAGGPGAGVPVSVGTPAAGGGSTSASSSASSGSAGGAVQQPPRVFIEQPAQE